MMSLLRKVFPLLSLSVGKTLVQQLVISRLDDWNALLATTNESTSNLIQNLPARMASTPLLSVLHWLPMHKIIIFKICCIVHESLNGRGPSYLVEKCISYQPGRPLRS